MTIETPDTLPAAGFHPVDVDSFLDRMWKLVERRQQVGASSSRATANKRTPPDPLSAVPPRIELVLYTSPVSEKSQRAIRAIQRVLKRYVAEQVRLSMCDLSERPQDGEVDSVVFTPTLVKQGPGPRTSIIGNLDNAEVLCDLLDASGVDRRWDD